MQAAVSEKSKVKKVQQQSSMNFGMARKKKEEDYRRCRDSRRGDVPKRLGRRSEQVGGKKEKRRKKGEK